MLNIPKAKWRSCLSPPLNDIWDLMPLSPGLVLGITSKDIFSFHPYYNPRSLALLAPFTDKETEVQVN